MKRLAFLLIGLGLLGIGPLAAQQAASSYGKPNLSAFGVDMSTVDLPASSLQPMAEDLATLARNLQVKGPTDERLRGQLLAMALLLDAQCREAVIASGQLARLGKLTPSKRQVDATSTSILTAEYAKMLESKGGTNNLRLASYLYDTAARLNPANEDIVYSAEMALAKNPVNWNAVIPSLAAPAAPAPGAGAAPSAMTASRPAAAAPVPGTPGQIKIHGLVVVANDEEELGGKMMEILIASNPSTFPSPPRFAREVGDEMRISMEEAWRLVGQRHPGAGNTESITLSFDDKYTPHDGGSAGTAFAVGMLALLEGIPIDPDTALTGDITIDGTVRKVGGIGHKLRGAMLDGCRYVAIPSANENDLGDILLVRGPQALYEMQIFSLDRLDDALAFTRVDRPASLKEAIGLFATLQNNLKGRSSALNSPETHRMLEEVVAKAPNHLSARWLLKYVNHKAPRFLTDLGTLEMMFASTETLRTALKPDPYTNQHGQIPRFSYPQSQYAAAEDKLLKLERIRSPGMEKAFTALQRLIKKLRYYDDYYHGVPYLNLIPAYKQVLGRSDTGRLRRIEEIEMEWTTYKQELARLDYDEKFKESLLHD